MESRDLNECRKYNSCVRTCMHLFWSVVHLSTIKWSHLFVISVQILSFRLLDCVRYIGLLVLPGFVISVSVPYILLQLCSGWRISFVKAGTSLPELRCQGVRCQGVRCQGVRCIRVSLYKDNNTRITDTAQTSWLEQYRFSKYLSLFSVTATFWWKNLRQLHFIVDVKWIDCGF